VSDCILWTRHIDRDGYGKASYGSAHGKAYEREVGPVPPGMELDHLCRNRACVNVERLEPVTHAENMRRSAAAQKTHCIHGHLYDEANTYLRPSGTNPRGNRACRACHRDRSRAYRLLLRERVA